MDRICIYFLLNNADITTSQDLGLSWHSGVAITFLQEEKVINTGCHSSISKSSQPTATQNFLSSVWFSSVHAQNQAFPQSKPFLCESCSSMGVCRNPMIKTRGKRTSFLNVFLSWVIAELAPKSSLASTEKGV